MSEGFIRTRTGAVNLRYVRRIREDLQKDGSVRHAVITDEGAEYAVHLEGDALDHLCQRIVPASAEDRACFVSVDPDNLTLAGVWEQHIKIVAWGVSVNHGGGYYGVQPIFADKPASNQFVLLRSPDGSWLVQEDAEYATLAEAKAAVLATHIDMQESKEEREAVNNAGQ